MRGSTRDANGAELFAEELTSARNAAGLSRAGLAQLIHYSESLVTSIELCRRAPTADVAQRLDEALGTHGTFARLQRHSRAAPLPSWFRPWAQVEEAATQLRAWQTSFVDGLLQTPEYARALLSVRVGAAEADTEQQVTARMERQAILERDGPPLLWLVLDESVLRRPVGGREVMRGQLEKLAEMAARPNVVVQVIPADAGAHEGLNGSFVIADFADEPSAVYLETALTGMIIDRTADVAAVALTYDGLRTEALRRGASAELIREVAKTWT